MKMIDIGDSKNNIVKKHNDLVRKARYQLGEQGKKIVAMLIAMIRADDADFQEYNIEVKEFARLTGTNSDDIYKQVDKATDELMKKPFKLGDEKFNWCYYARYHKGSGYVTLKIAPELKPYLLSLGGDFTEYNIENILLLKSSYVISLYELIISHWNNHKYYHPKAESFMFELEIEELRYLFEIPISQKYADIKRQIIDKAQRQFREKTDICFDYKEKKLGAKVLKLEMTIRANVKGSNDFLKSEQSFVSHMRKNFVNQPLAVINGVSIQISDKGNLYDTNTLKDFSKEESHTYWKLLFKTAQEDKLLCLKQGKLFWK